MHIKLSNVLPQCTSAKIKDANASSNVTSKEKTQSNKKYENVISQKVSLHRNVQNLSIRQQSITKKLVKEC